MRIKFYEIVVNTVTLRENIMKREIKKIVNVLEKTSSFLVSSNGVTPTKVRPRHLWRGEGQKLKNTF
ncbi:hypothetical protein BFU36_11865 [Sulfolobus sp. A20]|nr:hypothetical protein BFU36_11865 [Sulfolobus sp. A20]TRM73461.1 hypothetical protein DJ528_11680 [Sulfolobus sp. B5]TRM74127.1 hypothetical protein DJ532_13560 [Sulfolobus sp. A20-N-F8]TRM76103.1 hypothetical protein DJ523_01760 [Sulfolobus sp. E5]TRM80571.1 hypothetical protein DJ524_07140 [Sulfolobus sp. D5]TRM83328.1 hypothetical protein DJ531_06010 [Sulfolobus sp. A20-N-F6]TRM86098.1 hypothetical protein DJ521_06310 [Sulfolobus sp. E3]TRM87432.1 hypothetical protein DJ529_08470 [Sulfo